LRRQASQLGRQGFVAQGFSPIRETLDDLEVNLAIELVDLGPDVPDGLMLAHVVFY